MTDIRIQSVKFNADQKLIDFIEEKVGKLGRYAEGIRSADVTLRLEKDSEHGNKEVVLRLDTAAGTLLAERRARSFEEAVDLAIDALRNQIAKHKETF